MMASSASSDVSASLIKATRNGANRMIVVVTGANTGIGLGLCHRLLSTLSLPTNLPIPTSAQPDAFAPSQSRAVDPSLIRPRPEVTLTLILACRSLAKAQVAKEELLERHLTLLEKRRREGIAAPALWKDGLQIEIELLDVDSPNGKNGILDFCERLKQRYPYVTSLFSNAGILAGSTQHWGKMFLEVLKTGPAYTWSRSKAYMDEHVGLLSGDKKRGGVWGVNVFATYLLANELLPLLQRSPYSLPFSPRIIYTSSNTAELCDFAETDPADVQMLKFRNTYAPSKYIGDLLINDLDQRYGQPTSRKETSRPVRAFAGEPGCVATMAGKSAVAASPFFGIVQFSNWLMFVILRFFGSPWHPRDAEDATVALLYAALISDAYLPPVQNEERYKFSLISHPLRDATVMYRPLDSGDTEQAGEILRAQLSECERLRVDCRLEAGLN